MAHWSASAKGILVQVDDINNTDLCKTQYRKAQYNAKYTNAGI